MAADDDIAAALPQAPPPRPARRDSAIEAALRRFDGEGAAPLSPSRDRPDRAGWIRIGRPQAGALVAAGLVAILALPFAWTSFQPGGGGSAGPAAPPVPEAGAGNFAVADSAADEAEGAVSAPVTASPRPAGAPPPPPAAAADSAAAEPLEAPARAPVRSAAREPGRGTGSDAAAAAPAAREPDSPVTVTGARLSAPPAEAVPAPRLAAARAASAPPPRARGDWNACTVEDPARSLAACRGLVDAGAKGGASRSAAHLADGLARAWSGDYDGAIAVLDRAIAAEPRSASAWLNRGLVRRRKGESEAALADLDRAVRLAPASARAHYHRAQVLRQRGDLPRARADEARAAALDPRYAALRGPEE